MLDTIIEQLKETRDRQAVMILLQGLDAPLSVLTITSDALSGQFWIANGKYLRYAKVLPGGEGGLIDMLRLLAVKEADFSIEVVDGPTPPELPLQVKLAEIVADEHAVARKIKNVLWPVSEPEPESEPEQEQQSAESLTEAAVTEEPVTATKVSSETVGAALATPAESAPETPPVEAPQPEAPSAVASPTEEKKPAKGSKKKKSKKKLLQELEETKVRPAMPAEPVPEPVVEVAEEPIAEAAPEPVADAPQEPIAESLATDMTAAPEEPAAASLSSLFDSDDDEPETVATADTAPEPKPEWAQLSQFLLSEENPSTPEPTIEEGIVDPLEVQRRTEYEEIKKIMGESPEHFYDDSEAMSQMSDDELAEKRRKELETLGQQLADVANAAKAPPINPSATSDELKSKRRADYEALKLFYAEAPEKFEEAVGLQEKMGEGGLTDFQKRILEISRETTDPELFEEQDAKLKTGGDIFPVWDPTVEPPPLPGAEPSPLESQPLEPEYVARRVESPYGEDAAVVNRDSKLRAKLALGPDNETLELLNRRSLDRTNLAAAMERPGPREDVQKYVAIGIAGAILLPVMAFVIWHYFNKEAQEQLAMEREAALSASRSMEKKSVVAQPYEPFRMPAASANTAAPPNNSSERPEDIQKKGESRPTVSYEWQAPSTPTLLSGSQIADADAIIRNADNFMASGNSERAAEGYLNAVRKYPTYAMARVKAARAYIAAKKYNEAYQILQSGLALCQTKSDFDMLVSIIQEIP